MALDRLGRAKEVRLGSGGKGSGVVEVFRRDASTIALFFAPGLAGWVCVLALMLLGAIPQAVGVVLMVFWVVISFALRLEGANRILERKHREAAATETAAKMAGLASRLISLYPLRASSPDEESRMAEAFALYREASQSLEEDPRRAGEMVERGLLLADELLARTEEGGSER